MHESAVTKNMTWQSFAYVNFIGEKLLETI